MKSLYLRSWVYLLALTSPASAYVGGHDLPKNIPGIVKFTEDDNLSNCTGTILGPRHIMTATHCISKAPAGILGLPARIITGPHVPFTSMIQVLVDPNTGTYDSVPITVEKLHFFAAYALGPEGLSPMPSIDDLLALGDFAILELKGPIKELPHFTQILFDEGTAQDEVWVGGAGLRGQAFSDLNVRTFGYQGSDALLGNRLNQVSLEIVNREEEITYLAAGDSGGGVFKKVNGKYYLVGINHAGYTRLPMLYDQIQVDPTSGRVSARPQIEEGRMIGFVHYFFKDNQKLREWIVSVLPKSAYEIFPSVETLL